MSFLEFCKRFPPPSSGMSVSRPDVGSFLNVVIHRLLKCWSAAGNNNAPSCAMNHPPRKPLQSGHSTLACPHCDHAIGALETSPSTAICCYAASQGLRTANLARYPIIEAVSGILCAYAEHTSGRLGCSRRVVC